MKNLIACLLGVILILQPTGPSVARAANKDKDEDRLKDCGAVLKEILDIPDDIPQGLLDKADCVVVYPSVLKAAFVVGGSYGRGAMTCRQGETFRGSWGAQTMMALEGGSFGFQIGGQATDFVLLVMNEGGARGILAGKVKLGGEASVAAGPVGRDTSAETDVTFLFVGISLEGSTVRPDNKANEQIYGQKLEAKQIVLSDQVRVPAAAEQLVSTLNNKTPHHKP
jgi:SH3 domain-containing YSC84-like protein 1